MFWLLSSFGYWAHSRPMFHFYSKKVDQATQFFLFLWRIKRRPWSEMVACTTRRKINLDPSTPCCNKLASDNKYDGTFISENSLIAITNLHKYNLLKIYIIKTSCWCRLCFNINKRIHILCNEIRNFLQRIFLFSIFKLALKP